MWICLFIAVKNWKLGKHYNSFLSKLGYSESFVRRALLHPLFYIDHGVRLYHSVSGCGAPYLNICRTSLNLPFCGLCILAWGSGLHKVIQCPWQYSDTLEIDYILYLFVCTFELNYETWPIIAMAGLGNKTSELCWNFCSYWSPMPACTSRLII